MSPDQDLRRAVMAMDAAQRERLIETVRSAAASRGGPIVAVWTAFADLVDDVARMQRARHAAEGEDRRQPIRTAQRGRR